MQHASSLLNPFRMRNLFNHARRRQLSAVRPHIDDGILAHFVFPFLAKTPGRCPVLTTNLVVGVNVKGVQQELAHPRCVRIVLALAVVELADGIQLVGGQLEVKDLGVRLDP